MPWWFRWPGLVAVGCGVALLSLGLAWWARPPEREELLMAGTTLQREPAMKQSALRSQEAQNAPPAKAENRPLADALASVATLPSAPVPAAAPAALSGEPALASTEIHFTQIPVAAIIPPSVSRQSTRRAPSPAPTVLSDFKLSYGSGRAAIRDADGSVYSGTIRPMVPASAGGDAVRTPRPGGASYEVAGNALQSQVVVAGSYQVNLVGTNRSLRQRVAVDGVLQNIQQASQLSLPGRSAGPVGGGLQVTNSPPAPSWTLESRVNLGPQPPVQMNAIERVAPEQGVLPRR